MSLQLDRYLAARASGATVELACEQSGLLLGEAALWERDIASGEVELPPRVDFCDHESGQENRHHLSCARPSATKTENEPELSTKGETEMPKNDTTVEPITELAADTLRGGLRDAMLSWFKATPKPWAQVGEREQSDIADSADRCARQLVKQACQIIAASERPCIVAQLVEYKEKDGVEAKLKLPSKGDVVQALHEACGREVLIVTSGEEEFQGEEAPAEIAKDQPELGIGAEYADAA